MGDGYKAHVGVRWSNGAQLEESLLRNCHMISWQVLRDQDSKLQGQPQCLRKVTTVGLPSDTGKLSLVVVGAFSPTAGVFPSWTAEGDIHDQNSVCQVILNSK